MNPDARQIRLRWLVVLSWAALGVFLIRVGWMTVARGEYYAEEARKNFLLPNVISAPRGQILDRHLEPLAFNRLSYTLGVRPYQLGRDEIASTLRILSEMLGGDFEPFLDDIMALRPRWQTFELARDLTVEEAAPLLERQDQLPGLRLTAVYERFYPAGRVASHIIGFTGSIPAERWKQFEALGYSRSEQTGRAGLELMYESLLRGTAGHEVMKRNARGALIENMVVRPAQPGHTLVLTIDAGLQFHIYDLLSAGRGVIIVMDCFNGEILGMISRPDFDPNRVAASLRDEQDSFFNRAVQGLYPPGSTIKPLTALAFLRAGGQPDDTIVCGGRLYLPGWPHPFVCNNVWGHGAETLLSALQHSCNVYFYEAVRRTGVKYLLVAADEFGLTERTGVDLPGENSGSLGLERSDSVPGDLLLAAIGQGRVQETPLQMLRFICALANGDHLPVPHLARGVIPPGGQDVRPLAGAQNSQGRRIYLEESQRLAIVQGMRWVVQRPGGTAFDAHFPPEWDVAGKSGSAETARGDVDAWFVSFAPAHRPRWAVLVLLEGGGHGGEAAAPVAREVYRYLFEHDVGGGQDGM